MSSGIRDYVVRASDYAFSNLPLHAPAGWLTFRMANAGEETHMLSIASVPGGYMTSTFIDSLVHARLPLHTKFWAGVDVVSPGDTGVVSVFLPAGRYVAMCFVQSADGMRHIQRGMVGQFDVVAVSDTGTTDFVDGVVTLSRKRIRLSGPPLKRGIRTLRVASSNANPQDFQLLKLRPGRSASDALKWFTHRNIVAPAAEALGGVSSIYAGQRATMTVNFTPGEYLLVFQLDGTDAHPAFAQLPLTIRGK
ncbi:MAG: hypothetical protein ABI035_01020 [Gemmatimonadaceae bacterium]